ncbi:MAG: plectrovirus SVGII3 orf 2 transmembrane protein [Mycoplasmataceae bacterium RV_VA103A]|nr:MAG: plectrovirus SVGII3 orf 2 transmembrane protein [Mycoplasmataceae bacterium RV_VA103A]
MTNTIIKWTIILSLIFSLGQFLLIWWKQFQFKRLIKNQVSLAVVFGSSGQGKSLLFSWLVNRLSNTYTNFWHKKKGNQALLMDQMDTKGKVKIPVGSACYFVDEVNLYFRGVEYSKNQKVHSGIEDFCALARHFDKKVFFSVQRTNQLWVAIRDIANIYIKVKGIYTPLFLPWCSVLRLEIYEDIKLAEEWSSNMAPYQRSGFFSLFGGNDYDQAKKRLNIKEYKVFLKTKDFQNYDTKFFGALLPLLNDKRKEANVPKGQIPVPNALKGIIKQEYFTVKEKPRPTLWQRIKEMFTPAKKEPSTEKARPNGRANTNGSRETASLKKEKCQKS